MLNLTGNRPTYALIDVERFGKNIDTARQLSKSDIIAVVKADAYGHGAETLAQYAYQKKNVRNFAVATMTEGLNLRKFIPSDANIIVLGYITESFIKEAIKAELTLPVFDHSYAESISAIAQKTGQKVKVALEIDTGMSRLGFSYDLNLVDFLSRYVYMDITNVISHLATSDSDNNYAHEQTERFDKFLEINKGFTFATSFLNSSGIASYENRWTYTRPGIMLYGYESSGILKGQLAPVMSVWSEVAHVKRIRKGDTVGYGRTFKADKDMIIGVVPIGYADGYLRAFSNKAYMVADHLKCPVVGSVCMDMTMIDVTPLGMDCKGQKVQILGDDVTADMWAEWGNTINYEALCGISYRIPRVYGRF
ncbi:MAG: alanine racemase [Deferribacterales bacterium]|nr:alanine racemase [Deferribacterales bacterium]